MHYLRTLMVDLLAGHDMDESAITARVSTLSDALEAIIRADAGASDEAKAALIDALIAARSGVVLSTVANRKDRRATGNR